MRIAIGADHAGFPLKEHLAATLVRLGHQVDDRGAYNEAPTDYPPICADVARLVVTGGAAPCAIIRSVISDRALNSAWPIARPRAPVTCTRSPGSASICSMSLR